MAKINVVCFFKDGFSAKISSKIINDAAREYCKLDRTAKDDFPVAFYTVLERRKQVHKTSKPRPMRLKAPSEGSGTTAAWGTTSTLPVKEA
jgi:hypothetical protein